jgi:anti-sigma28 factor (negative regulator of flagellin synthesis)
MDQLRRVKTSVEAGVAMAAGERSERLHVLTQAVRSGTYRPNASQLAEQILAEAELDAKLARM